MAATTTAAVGGASYYAGTACHLDLVQWATAPVQGKLHDHPAAQLLTVEGRRHRMQLALASVGQDAEFR